MRGGADRDSELSKAQLTEYVSGSATDEEKNALMDRVDMMLRLR